MSSQIELLLDNNTLSMWRSALIPRDTVPRGLGRRGDESVDPLRVEGVGCLNIL